MVVAVLAILASTAVDAVALEVCNSGQVTATDPGCPPGDGVCTITLALELTDSLACRLDFGSREVRVQSTIHGAGTVTLTSGPLTINPGASILGARVYITAQGDVIVRRVAGSVPGLIEVSVVDEYDYAELHVSTPGHFLLEGRLVADSTGAELPAGAIEINAAAGITTAPASLLSADHRIPGEFFSQTGSLLLDTGGQIVLQGTVNLRGPGEGEDRLGGEIGIRGGSLRLAPGTVVRGGTIDVDIQGDVRIERESAARRALIEADETGSSIIISTTGDLLVAGEVSTNGSTCERGINYLGLSAEGALTVTPDALLSASGVPDPEEFDVCSAYVDISADGPLLFEGTLVQLGGGDPEGDAYISGDGDVTIKGRIRMDGWYKRSQGGSLNVSGTKVVVESEITTVAGASTLGIEEGGYSGNVDIDGSDVFVGGSIITDGPLYGSAGLIDIDAPRVTLTGSLSAHAHRLYVYPGRVHILAGESLDFRGSIDAGNGGEVQIVGGDLDIGGRIIGHTQPGYPRQYFLGEPKVSVESYGGCGSGRATFSGLIELSAFGCEGGVCADPWAVEVVTNKVTLTPSAVLENTGRVGGRVHIKGAQLALDGHIDVSGAETDGVVEVARCAGAEQPCTVTGEIEPPSALMNGCLLPAPTVPPTHTPTPTRTAVLSPTTGPITCPGDCDNDGVVESTDLTIVLSLVNLCQGNAGGCGLVAASCANADLDHSGTISAGEVSRVVGSVGTRCL